MSRSRWTSWVALMSIGCGSTSPTTPNPGAGDDGGSVSPPDASSALDAATPEAASDAAPTPPACPLPTDPDPIVGQQLPRAHVDTSWPSLAGKTIAVHAGGDLQAAIDAAQLGDTIAIDAGATFTGPFHLRAKTGSGWIVLASSSLSKLPASGARVTPADAPSMPKIVAPSQGNAFDTDPDAHHYRLVGLEITPADPSTPMVYDMVLAGDPNQTSLDHVAHDLIFDRIYLHGTPTATVKRGIQLAGSSVAVIDSWLSDIHVVGQDAQALGCFNGPGPYRIANDHLEASTENVLFGGSDPTVPNLIPSDIEVVGNYFTKSLAWKSDDASYAGTPWAVKNLFELKNARRVLAACNVLEHNWTMGQVGFAVLFTPRNQGGTAPWSTVEDITFVHNVVRHTASMVNLLGTDNDYPSGQLQRVLVSDNLAYDIDGTRWIGQGMFVQIGAGAAGVKFDHNTVIQSGNVIGAYGTPDTSFVFTNNLTPHNAYGVIGDSHAPGNDSIMTFLPTATFRRNALVALPTGMSPTSYPPDNLFPATLADVKFVDLANDDYRLQPSSPLHGAAIDGSDVGADVALVQQATAGVIK